MKDFCAELEARLQSLRDQGLHRQLRPVHSAQGTRLNLAGRRLLNFSSNDYLGLASHPALRAAAVQALAEYGSGSGASRLICGSLAPHGDLDAALARFKGTEAALAFSSGYAAAVGTICALVGAGDFVVIDKLVHASIVDGARLSGAKLRVFDHNDTEDLERILQWTQTQRAEARPGAQVLIITETVFSMDGDLAPLRQLVELKEKYRAWLMVDEAHATGLFGENRRGLAEAQGVSDRIEVQMGTLGKALGSAGGFICGPRPLIDLLINRARSFIFSTAPVPAAAASATAALQLIGSTEGEERRQRLWANIDRLKNSLIKAGWKLPPVQSAIIPLLVGSEEKAMALAGRLLERGLFIPAIRYPTVARGQARLRLTVSADHTPADIATLVAALQEEDKK